MKSIHTRALLLGAVALVIVLSWLFGFEYWFKNSDDWAVAKKVISNSPAVQADVGEVGNISINWNGFSYQSDDRGEKISGEIVVHGAKGTQGYKISMDESVQGVWTIRKLEKY